MFGKDPDPKDHISRSEGIFYIVLSIIVLIFFLIYGLIQGDVNFPNRYTKGLGLRFQGLSAWIMRVAIICVIVNMSLVLIEYYDKKNNERRYKEIFRVIGFFAFILVVLALAIEAFNKILN